MRFPLPETGTSLPDAANDSIGHAVEDFRRHPLVSSVIVVDNNRRPDL